MDDRPDVDTLAAEQILDLADDTVESRQEARDYIMEHDMVRALGYLVDTGAVRKISIILDTEDKDKGEFAGLRISTSGAVSVKTTTRHGTSTDRVSGLSDSDLETACEGLDTTEFQKAAVDTVRDETAQIRNAN